MNDTQRGQLTQLVDWLRTNHGDNLDKEQAKLHLSGRGTASLREQAVTAYLLVCRAVRIAQQKGGGGDAGN